MEEVMEEGGGGGGGAIGEGDATVTGEGGCR